MFITHFFLSFQVSQYSSFATGISGSATNDSQGEIQQTLKEYSGLIYGEVTKWTTTIGDWIGTIASVFSKTFGFIGAYLLFTTLLVVMLSTPGDKEYAPVRLLLNLLLLKFVAFS